MFRHPIIQIPRPPQTTSPTGKLITGVVYYDSNTNGVRELDTAMDIFAEVGVAGVTETALDMNGSQCGQTVSSSEPGKLGSELRYTPVIPQSTSNSAMCQLDLNLPLPDPMQRAIRSLCQYWLRLWIGHLSPRWFLPG